MTEGGEVMDKIKFVNARGAMMEFQLLSIERIPLDINVPIENLVDGDGAVKTGVETVETKRINVSGPIYSPDTSETDDIKDSLFNLMQYTPIQIYRRERFLFAYPAGLPQRWIDTRELRIDMNFVCPDPFWYGSEQELVNPPVIGVEGNYRTYPKIRLDINESTTGSIQIDNDTTGQVFYIDEIEVEDEDEIIINNESFVVEHEEEKILSKVDDSWLIDGFYFVKGANELSYSGIDADITYKYRNKWL